MDRTAWKGSYKLLRSSDDAEDVIYLNLAFTKKYERQRVAGTATFTWQMIDRFEPQGMMLEIPLEDSTIPDQVLTASVSRAIFVDQDGQEVTKRYDPNGFLQTLSGQGSIRSLRHLGAATLGETLRLKKYENGLEAIDFSRLLPPGYRIREKQQQVVAKFRPEADSSVEKLWNQVKQSKDPKEIIETTNVLLKLDSNRAEFYELRAQAFVALEDQQRAIDSYSKAIALEPKNASFLRSRARRYSLSKQYGKAKADYSTALEIDPSDDDSVNGLAWTMSTSPDANVRDGTNAIKYAKQVCNKTEFKNWMYVDTLAAAYAEAGDFRRAVLWQTEALDLLTEEKWREEMKERLESYKRDKPHRQE